MATAAERAKAELDDLRRGASAGTHAACRVDVVPLCACASKQDPALQPLLPFLTTCSSIIDTLLYLC